MQANSPGSQLEQTPVTLANELSALCIPGPYWVSETDLQISAKNGPEAAHSSAEMQSFPSERTKPALQVTALPSPFLVQLNSPASQGVQVLSSAMGRNVCQRRSGMFCGARIYLGWPSEQQDTLRRKYR